MQIRGLLLIAELIIILETVEAAPEIRVNVGNSGFITALAVSSDGKLALAGSADASVVLWEIASARELKRFKGHSNWVNSVAFSPDSHFAASSSSDGSTKLWDIDTGQLFATYKENGAIAFSPDGTQIAIGKDGDVSLRDVKSGNQSGKGFVGDGKVGRVVFAKDGASIFLCTATSVSSWNPGTGKVSRILSTGSFSGVPPIDISPNQDLALAGWVDKSHREVKIYNLKTGQETMSLNAGQTYPELSLVRQTALTFSPNGTSALVAFGSQLRLWNIGDGSESIVFEKNSAEMDAVVFSPDGRLILSGDESYAIRTWDSTTGSPTAVFGTHAGELFSLDISADGNLALTGSGDGSAKLWRLDRNGVSKVFGGYSSGVAYVAFSPDSRYAYVGAFGSELKLWDIQKGSSIRSTTGFAQHVSEAAFSPDGHLVAEASDTFSGAGQRPIDDLYSIHLRNLDSGQELFTLKAHQGAIESLQFSKTGQFLYSVARDGTFRKWDTRNGTLLATSIADNAGEWVTWTPEGYFSGTPKGIRDFAYVVDGLRTYSIDQLFNNYYRPDLVEAALGGAKVSDLSGGRTIQKGLGPPPRVFLEIQRADGRFRSADISQENSPYRITDGLLTARASALDQGGGLGTLTVYQNGKAVGESLAKEKIYTVTFALADGRSVVAAVGTSVDGVESNPASVSLTYTSPNTLKPILWILAVGVNKYKNEKYDLNYAVGDVDAFAASIGPPANRLFGKVETTVLTDGEATREGVSAALNAISKKARPEDVFVFYYAGHGIALPNPISGSNEFYYVLQGTTQMTDVSTLNTTSISGTEFRTLVSSIGAQRQFYLLDACNSGALTEAFAQRGAAEEIALAKLSRATGSVLIAASQADQFAQEFPSLGHGVLTQALIDGLAGKASNAAGQITALSLKSYVEDALPLLTVKYLGKAQYASGFSYGQDFPLGLD